MCPSRCSLRRVPAHETQSGRSWSGLTWLALAALALVGSVACKDPSPASEPPSQTAQVQITAPVPTAVVNAGLDASAPGALSASVQVDGSAAVALAIAGGTASGAVNSVAVGQRAFVIDFIFTHNSQGAAPVARASVSRVVSTGNNALDIQDADYDTAGLDNDSDGVVNIDEFAAGTDPTVPPTWGDLIWGGHRLGGT